MNIKKATQALLPVALLMLTASGAASAATATYVIDPSHTYPSFEADHMGISVWRGKINKTSGKVTLDKAAEKGDVDIAVDLASIDFGMDDLSKWAIGPDFFDTAKYPQATYKGKLAGFKNGVPSKVIGEMTLHGVTKPMELKIDLFKCMPHPATKQEVCGADAIGTFNREDFGLKAGKDFGFKMDVNLRIQVEAMRAE